MSPDGSMNDTPRPLIVRAINTFGTSSGAPRMSPNARASASWSWPLHVSTCQPNARSFDSSSPSARISSVGLSDCSSLRSTIAHRLPTRWCAAEASASQFCPSCSSPSPVITTTRPPRPRKRFAQAIPRPFDSPIPSEPEFASIPGTRTSGWPSSPPSRRSRSNRSAGITPSACSAAYSPGTSCPFDEKKTSRSGWSQPSSTTFSSRQSRWTTTSSAPKLARVELRHRRRHLLAPGYVVDVHLQDPHVRDRRAPLGRDERGQVAVVVVRRAVHLEGLGEVGDLLRLMEAVPDHVHRGHVQRTGLEERTEAAAGVEVLTRADRDRRAAAHARERLRVERVDLEPHQVEVLQPARDPEDALCGQVEVQIDDGLGPSLRPLVKGLEQADQRVLQLRRRIPVEVLPVEAGHQD